MSQQAQLRSLIQKTIRRGYSALAKEVAYCLADTGDGAWLRKRIGTIAFEECWPSAINLFAQGNKTIEGIEFIALSSKQKDAAGLGTLAYGLSNGFGDTLEFAPDPRAVRIVAAGLSRPKDFFAWAKKNTEGDRLSLTLSAEHYFSFSSWPWDKAFAVAGAYLSVTGYPISIEPANILTEEQFPYWVAIDKHTAEGKAALARVASKLSVQIDTLSWASFYFESAKVNSSTSSDWWNAELLWRLKKLQLSYEQAKTLWEETAPLVKAEVEPVADHLRLVVENRASRQFFMN